MTIVDALISLRPNAQFTVNDEDLSTVVWYTKDVTTPTQKEVDNEIKRLEDKAAAEVTAKAANKESARAKLAALGLTGEEIAALSN
jgi:Pyruvate/2-oxoacid:ferredoxin oxidoreductase gamma subunit